MSKKINITVEVEVQDDDYENHYKEDLENSNNGDEFKDLLLDWIDWDVPLKVSNIVVRESSSNVVKICKRF